MVLAGAAVSHKGSAISHKVTSNNGSAVHVHPFVYAFVSPFGSQAFFPSFFAVRTILLRGKQYLQRRSRLKYVEGYKQYSPFSSLLKI